MIRGHNWSAETRDPEREERVTGQARGMSERGWGLERQ